MSNYDEDIDYQTNALRSFIQETVSGVPTNNEEPLDFSLSDLPLSNNTEDVPDDIIYRNQRSTTDKVIDTVQDYGVKAVGGVAQGGLALMELSTLVPRTANYTVGKTADALGFDSVALKSKEFERDVSSWINDKNTGINQFVEDLTSDYGRYASQKGFQWSDPLSDESLYSLGANISNLAGNFAVGFGFGGGASKVANVAGKGVSTLGQKVMPYAWGKFGNYMNKVSKKLTTRFPVENVQKAIGRVLDNTGVAPHILYWMGMSANDLQHEAYNVFDRIPDEYKSHSPKFLHILELVKSQNPELTPEQQIKKADEIVTLENYTRELFETYTKIIRGK